ncbi:MAG: hypothetical protein GY796_02830 [Chloroflexi bacterium]|nr:hypothetical protein [Chloroflexota bacterium]
MPRLSFSSRNIRYSDQEKLQHTIFPAVNSFGCYLGRAFQIMDDLLDVTSDFDGRKQVGNDIYESKRSLLLAHLMQQVTPEDHTAVTAILSKPHLEKTAAEIQTVIKLMDKHGTLTYARQQADLWANKTCQALGEIDFFVEETAVAHIHTITEFVVKRTF